MRRDDIIEQLAEKLRRETVRIDVLTVKLDALMERLESVVDIGDLAEYTPESVNAYIIWARERRLKDG